jgi:Glu-tRNA(Gln) amidotransferase subunit E-like FAD-binding protein
MNGKKIEDLSEQEFRGMLDHMASEEFDRLTVAQFFDVLAAMEEDEPREAIERRATVKEGQLAFLEPTPLPTHGNQIRIGDKCVVITLVPEEVSSAAP